MNLNDSWDTLVESKSKYLKQSDVGEDGRVLTVKGFRREVLDTDDGQEEKTVLHFVEDVKPMVLGPTNKELLRVATGAITPGEAKGKQILVFADPTVMFGGKATGGLRIRKAQAAPKTTSDDDPGW